jgi:chitinase
MISQKCFLLPLVMALGHWSFAQSPERSLVGYWHNWNAWDAPYIPIDQADDRYNVITVAFALPAQGSTCQMEFQPEGATPAEFKSKIQNLQAAGKKVLISVGGATAIIELGTPSQRDIFVNTMLDIIGTYGFDGMDIDLEGSSVFTTGGTIAAPSDPKIIHLISAIKDIMEAYFEQYDKHMMLTMAPETAFVQGGQSAFGGIWGAYLPVIHALRDSIDILHVQLYNSGTMFGIDGNIYMQGTADFIVSQTEALLQGFQTTAGFFAPLQPKQVAVGLPACPLSAGGGYTPPDKVSAAIGYLMGTGPKPGTYQRKAVYPDLRGMMTWSINWDKVPGCASEYEFAGNFESIFGTPSATTERPAGNPQAVVFPNPLAATAASLSLQLPPDESLRAVEIFAPAGNRMLRLAAPPFSEAGSPVDIPLPSLSHGLYLIRAVAVSGTTYMVKIVVQQ